MYEKPLYTYKDFIYYSFEFFFYKLLLHGMYKLWKGSGMKSV